MNDFDSCVYVLVYPHLNAIKVGKANVILNRIQQLSHWGKPDLEKSFQICVNKVDVFKLESALHFLLKEFNKEMGCADGFTEFFDVNCYSKICELIELLDFKVKKIKFIESKVVSNNLSGSALRLRKFENKINRYYDSMITSVNYIDFLKKSIVLMKKFDLSIYIDNRNKHCDELVLVIRSRAFDYSSFIFGMLKLGQISSFSGEIGSSFIIPKSKYNHFFAEINLSFFSDFVDDALKIGRVDYIQALIFCFDFLKKDLPNESELPTIRLNKSGKLEIE